MRILKSFVLISFVLCGVLGTSGRAHARSLYPALADPSVRVFQLESEDGRQRCSVTLIPRMDLRSGQSCRLVTNAHCIPDETSQYRLSTPAGSLNPAVEDFFGFLSKSENVRVVRINRSADLAELSVPPVFQKMGCSYRNLEEHFIVEENVLDKNKVVHSSKSEYYAALGYHRGQPIVSFSGDADWSKGAFTPARLYRSSTSLSALEAVFDFTNLALLNGMSGGATIDSQGHVVGINVRLVQSQDESFVIPLKEVLRFLDSEDSKRPPGLTGENGSENAGENSGAHAGENSGAHAGDQKKKSPKPKTPLSFFKEPEEGIDINVNGETKHLLGIGQKQIDGFDDLREHQNSQETRIYRDSAEFDHQIRRKLFSRLQGDYRPSQAVVPDVIYRWNAEDLTWTPSLKASSAAWIVIQRRSDRRASILLNYVDTKDNGFRAVYEATLSQDGSLVSLASEDGKSVLQCQNNNYLKLICSNQNEEFSLSMVEVGGTNLTFRSARLQSDGTVRYVYGRLQRLSR